MSHPYFIILDSLHFIWHNCTHCTTAVPGCIGGACCGCSPNISICACAYNHNFYLAAPMHMTLVWCYMHWSSQKCLEVMIISTALSWTIFSLPCHCLQVWTWETFTKNLLRKNQHKSPGFWLQQYRYLEWYLNVYTWVKSNQECIWTPDRIPTGQLQYS